MENDPEINKTLSEAIDNETEQSESIGSIEMNLSITDMDIFKGVFEILISAIDNKEIDKAIRDSYKEELTSFLKGQGINLEEEYE